MNFFQHQDDARTKSAQLVFLLIAAVLFLIFITTLGIAIFIYYFETHATSTSAVQAYNTPFLTHLTTIMLSPIMLWVSLGVCAVVLSGSAYKALELKKGGAYVAQSLGGKLLVHDLANTKEKQILNIIEEMAIASGTPVPQVYLLEEPGINAFAAGTQPSNAVIGVTRGCCEILNRDQLQGVVAHEFSHIHHGDMRLNMRLISALHGILVIGLLGQLILRSTVGHHGHRRRSSKDKNGNQLAILGLGLMAVGYGGTFFGNMIKSAVSRQREFLADASAVQYTRNPDGIAAALLKIKTHATGSNLDSKNASEFSHFYFSSGIKPFFSSLFSTHPPLDERIKRVYPNGVDHLYDAIAREKKKSQTQAKAHSSQGNTAENATVSQSESPVSNFSNSESTESSAPPIVSAPLHAETAPSQESRLQFCDSIGDISPESLSQSGALLAALPAILYEASHTPFQARAVAYALLLDSEPTIRKKQVTYLKARANPVTYKEFIRIESEVLKLDVQLQLPLLQLCLPALQALSVTQSTLFEKNLYALVKMDNVISIEEWARLRVIFNSLKQGEIKNTFKLDALKNEITQILSFITKLNSEESQEKGYHDAASSLWGDSSPEQTDTVSIQALDKAINKLRALSPLHKPKLLKALHLCMSADNEITAQEYEILRTIAIVLDCPAPLMS